MAVSASRVLSSDRLALAFVAGWLVLAQAKPASAAEPTRTVSLVVEGDSAGCVDASTMASALLARGARSAPDAKVRLRAKVSRIEGSVLVAVGGDLARGPLEGREFRAQTCEEAVDALALYASLAADTNDAAPPPSDGAETAIVAPATSAPTPTAREKAAPAAPFVPTIALGVTASSLAEGQVGARLAFALAAARIAFPVVEASLELPIPRTLSGGGGEANVFSLRGRGTVVPVAVPVGSASLFGPYVAIEGGGLFVSGSGPSRVESQARPYGAAAAGGMGRVAIGGHFSLVFAAGATIPFLRDTFVFVNGGTAYRVPAAGFEASFLVGMSFP